MIGKYISARTADHAGLLALISRRCYPVVIPQVQNAAADLPAITYTVTKTPKNEYKDGPATIDEYTVTFNIWGTMNDYATLDDVDEALRDALDYVDGEAGGVTVITASYEGTNDGLDEKMEYLLKTANYRFLVKR